MTNEKDWAIAAEVVDKFNLTDCRRDGITLTNGAIANLTRRIAETLTTARQEAREAAFKELRDKLSGTDGKIPLEEIAQLIMKELRL